MSRLKLYVLIVFFYLMLFWLPSCNLLKDSKVNKSSAAYHGEGELTAFSGVQKNWSKDAQRISISTDSSEYGYHVQLWPRGLFTYSPGQGFTGEADSMKILGGGKKAVAATSSTAVREADQDLTVRQLHTKQETDSSLKQKSRLSSPPITIIAGVICCILVAGWLYAKRKIDQTK